MEWNYIAEALNPPPILLQFCSIYLFFESLYRNLMFYLSFIFDLHLQIFSAIPQENLRLRAADEYFHMKKYILEKFFVKNVID